MNWELIHRIRRARRERAPQLLQQTQRLGHCIAVADDAARLSTAVAAVAGQRATWDTVATALCDLLTDAAVALDAIDTDAAFTLDQRLQRIATALDVGPVVTTLRAAVLLSPALLQRPRPAA